MRLALGTVQFGMDYGVTNQSGQIETSTCEGILRFALESGVTLLDTASGYGESERVLGEIELSQRFSVISKVKRLQNQPDNTLRECVESSLLKLHRHSLFGLLLHDEDDLLCPSADHYFAQLNSLKDQGLVRKIGVSVYSPWSAEIILSRYDIDIIQVPGNQLDRRFESSGLFDKARRNSVDLHVRSLFLQGLLAVDRNVRPDRFRDDDDLQAFDRQVEALGVTPMQLALSYLSERKQINYGVVGCTSENQLKEIIESYNFCRTKPIDCPDIATLNEQLINPTNW